MLTLQQAESLQISRGHVGKSCSGTERAQIGALKQCDERLPACDRAVAVSQEAVLGGHEGKPVEGTAGAGAGRELWGLTHRGGNHFSGELRIDVLGVSWTSLLKTNRFLNFLFKINNLKHANRKK